MRTKKKRHLNFLRGGLLSTFDKGITQIKILNIKSRVSLASKRKKTHKHHPPESFFLLCRRESRNRVRLHLSSLWAEERKEATSKQAASGRCSVARFVISLTKFHAQKWVMNRHLNTPGLAKLAAWPACRERARRARRTNRPRDADRPSAFAQRSIAASGPLPWLIGRRATKDWKNPCPTRAAGNCEFSLRPLRIDCALSQIYRVENKCPSAAVRSRDRTVRVWFRAARLRSRW
jgi:hypothetical protein